MGPTAIGKTSLAITLAQYFDTEIISADSRQFFKEMYIGTAVPSKDEQHQAPHHFIQHISINDPYNVGQYELEALAKIEALFKKHDILILVGGSGLYSDAVLNGLDSFPEVHAEVRKQIRETFDKKSLDHAQKRLRDLDPEYYQKVDLNNTQRVLRALEVCVSSGRPYSSFLKKGSAQRPFKALQIGLMADRAVIYTRINKRVDLMFNNGLEDEALKLFPFKGKNALNTVGYKELFNFFEGKYDRETAIAEIKKNTRRFAKRQLTWYRKNPEIKWFDFESDPSEIIGFIKKKF